MSVEGIEVTDSQPLANAGGGGALALGARTVPPWDFDRLLGAETKLVLVRDGLDAVAKRMGLSTRTVRRRIREAGTTAVEVVRETRAEEALKLLRGTDPFRSISSRLGYESARCFSRFVSREFGLTPTEVRRRIRGSEAAECRPGRR